MKKSSVEEIRARFDNDVERFSNLETGQSATIDASLSMELVTEAAAVTCPHARSVLDIGCGAGNYTLKLLQQLHNLDCTLIDLSGPMLDRARQRVSAATTGEITILQGDIRELEIGEMGYDIVMAAASLHHLREEDEWRKVFAKIYRSLAPRGSVWISDIVMHSTPGVQQMMWNRYGQYLKLLKGDEYRDHVFEYIEHEDTPRTLLFQLDMLRRAGFREVEILHKNCCFAAFGGVK